jgi:hypothetical protein
MDVIGLAENCGNGVFELAVGSWLARISGGLDGEGSMEWKRVWDLINGESAQGI